MMNTKPSSWCPLTRHSRGAQKMTPNSPNLRHSQCGGHRFDPGAVHQTNPTTYKDFPEHNPTHGRFPYGPNMAGLWVRPLTSGSRRFLSGFLRQLSGVSVRPVSRTRLAEQCSPVHTGAVLWIVAALVSVTACTSPAAPSSIRRTDMTADATEHPSAPNGGEIGAPAPTPKIDPPPCPVSQEDIDHARRLLRILT